jgi:hypothetical protein
MTNASGAGSLGSVVLPLVFLCAVAVLVLKQPTVQTWLRTWALNNGVLKEPLAVPSSLPTVSTVSTSSSSGSSPLVKESTPSLVTLLSAVVKGWFFTPTKTAEIPSVKALLPPPTTLSGKRVVIEHREWMDDTLPELGQWWVVCVDGQQSWLVSYTAHGVQYLHVLEPSAELSVASSIESPIESPIELPSVFAKPLPQATHTAAAPAVVKKMMDATYDDEPQESPSPQGALPPFSVHLPQNGALSAQTVIAAPQQPSDSAMATTIPVWLAKARVETLQAYPDD